MTEKEEDAIEVLVACQPSENHMGSPVQEVGNRLGFANTSDARAFVEDMANRKLIRTKHVGGGNNILETGSVRHMLFAWEKVPNAELRNRIEHCVSEEFPGCVVVFDETHGHFVRFRIETADGHAVLTNASPDLEPSGLEDLDDRELRRLLLSLCGR